MSENKDARQVAARDKMENVCVNTVRFLCVDAVQKANSGHPGMPMEAAPIAYLLWTKYMRHNPKNPKWPGRDRFVLSAGHGSTLLYSMLFLTGYDLPLDEIKSFRQWGSKTPGHPEYGHTPGVEVTTGPLGQGFANGVGMAMAERSLAARFNRPGHDIVDYTVYGIVSDGDMMEGVSAEAASLAGHLGLGNIIYIYLDNRITIEGTTDLAFSEDVATRFRGYDWHVQRVDGSSMNELEEAIRNAREEKNRPSLIIARTHIGYGSPNKQDSPDAHGSPLGQEEIRLTKANLGWPESPEFHLPDEALAIFRKSVETGAALEGEWKKRLDGYRRNFPSDAGEFDRRLRGDLPDGWKDAVPVFTPADGKLATREASGKVLNQIAAKLPELIGGSADLAPSTNTLMKGLGDFNKRDFGGRNLRFGIREHAMGSIMNGMALSGAIIPFGATFFVFTDYMKPPIRLSALMGLRVIYIFTHDSIGVGEDGPTHQPIEHLAALRSIPGIAVIRPSEATEVASAWKVALQRSHAPTALILTRQKLPVIDRTKYPSADQLEKGGYVLVDTERPEVIIIATGSEVSLALGAHERLVKEGIRSRVVSMPSMELFEAQSKEYREWVLPASVKARLAVEAGSPFGWHRYTGDSGDIIGMNTFGASAPGDTLMEKFGFSVENVVNRAKALIGKK